MQLAERRARARSEGRTVEDVGRDPEDDLFLLAELDRWQLEVTGQYPITLLVVEVRVVRARLDGDAEIAQIVLVALEHPLERGVRQALVASTESRIFSRARYRRAANRQITRLS